jgi:hypothetical protein
MDVDQFAPASYVAGLSFLIRNLLHRPEIVFGVLEVILRRDPIPGQSFGAGQIQIALIVSLGVLRVPRLGTGVPERFGSPGCSRHCLA